MSRPARDEYYYIPRWIEDPEQTSRIKCDFVISAFGSGLYSADLKEAMVPLQMNR